MRLSLFREGDDENSSCPRMLSGKASHLGEGSAETQSWQFGKFLRDIISSQLECP